MTDKQAIAAYLSAEAYDSLFTQRIDSVTVGLQKYMMVAANAALHPTDTPHQDSERLAYATLLDLSIAQQLTQSRTLSVLEEINSTLADISRTMTSMKDDTEAIEKQTRKTAWRSS